MNIFRETMVFLLRQAIQDQQSHEKQIGYTIDSAYLATLREMMKVVEAGGQIHMET